MKPFDHDNPFEDETMETSVETDENSIDTSINAEWDKITAAHADSEEAQQRATACQQDEIRKQMTRERRYAKRCKHRRENVAIDSIRHGLLAVGLGILCYFMIRYDVSWLAWVLGIGAGVTGLISAYCAGKYHEM